MPWESPIKLDYTPFWEQIVDAQENAIYKAVMKVNISVDREEMVKALKYDRQQYEKGYVDGRAERDREIVRCKDCKYLDHFCDEEIDLWCSAWENVTSEDGFCHYGKRKENDEEEETA